MDIQLQIQNLVKKLKKENSMREYAFNFGLSESDRIAAIGTFNYTLEIIKQLEDIAGKVDC